MTIFEHFLMTSSKHIARPAFRYLGKETSYNDVRLTIAKLSYLYQHELAASAASLKDLRVAMIARNSPSLFKTFFALTNIRVPVIPLSPDAPPSEWAEAFRETKPTHVAVTSDMLSTVRDFLNHERFHIPIIEIEKKQGGEYDTSFTPPPDNKPLESDLVLLVRSGGRTGKPKFVSINHKELQHAASTVRVCWKPLPTDRVLTTLSWAHPFSFVHSMLFPLLNGMTMVIDHGLQAVEFLDFLVESRVTRLVGVPSFYLKLLVTCRNEKRPLVGIKSAIVGVGTLSHELKRAFQVLKIPAPHVYGQVENVWTIAMEGLDTVSTEPGLFGRALVGLKYKVMDPNGDEIEGRERRVGMLAVSGPSIMTGYFGKEHEKDTRNALRGSWLYTGDYAALEGEGDELSIEFLGRRDDVLNQDGEITSISHMDTVLRKIPGLVDAAGFVAKNVRGQTVPLAVLVKNHASPLNEHHVMDFCKEHMPDGLNPVAITFVDTIPRDIGGNVNYHKLRSQFSQIAG
jgi:acyl-CoA synthetase (AMP-forming)/AMP-acid ligase II